TPLGLCPLQPVQSSVFAPSSDGKDSTPARKICPPALSFLSTAQSARRPTLPSPYLVPVQVTPIEEPSPAGAAPLPVRFPARHRTGTPATGTSGLRRGQG